MFQWIENNTEKKLQNLPISGSSFKSALEMAPIKLYFYRLKSSVTT